MRILFQGDSITDCGRDRADMHNLGNGYVKYAADMIAHRHPTTEFEFINLGISGNRVHDLYNRWQAECIALQPDFLSILIGVNDTWHCAGKESGWMPNAEFEEYYRRILTDVKEHTKAKIMILEQFLLPTEDKAFFREDLDPKIQITRKLAREFADVFIPLDGIFAAHSVGMDPTVWAADGVHPSEAGRRLIAQYYLDGFEKVYQAI